MPETYPFPPRIGVDDALGELRKSPAWSMFAPEANDLLRELYRREPGLLERKVAESGTEIWRALR